MEMIFQYMWKHKMLPRPAFTVDGRKVEILSAGVLNVDSGPDFTGARIRIDGQEWVGNVEIHTNASDWYRHNHQTDPAYENVILHVVRRSDGKVTLSDGRILPQLELPYSDTFGKMYLDLSRRIRAVPCEGYLHALPPLIKSDWVSTLAVERLQAKAERISQTAESLGGDWERACFVTLARALGFGLNGDPLEMLARSVPLKFLLRHSDHPLQLEALLFGQAGMLDSSCHIFDEYYQLLCREYYFLARKYGLHPIRVDLWKYARTRPGNFPHRRIAMLASSLKGGFSLMGRIVEARQDPARLRSLFAFGLSDYWKEHFDFDRPGAELPVELSQGSVSLLMINFAAPLIAAVARRRGDFEMGEHAFILWESIAPERNRYITQWAAAGMDCRTAADSQALLQLRKEYCDRERCLECRLGHALLRRSLLTPTETAGMLSPFDIPLEPSAPAQG